MSQICQVNAVLAIFGLGIANFALHKAVLESRHPLLGAAPLFRNKAGGRVTLGVEFVALLVAMVLVASDRPGWGWAYLAYTLFNGVSAWLILTRRI
jgi:hypothetical protein